MLTSASCGPAGLLSAFASVGTIDHGSEPATASDWQRVQRQLDQRQRQRQLSAPPPPEPERCEVAVYIDHVPPILPAPSRRERLDAAMLRLTDTRDRFTVYTPIDAAIDAGRDAEIDALAGLVYDDSRDVPGTRWLPYLETMRAGSGGTLRWEESEMDHVAYSRLPTYCGQRPSEQQPLPRSLEHNTLPQRPSPACDYELVVGRGAYWHRALNAVSDVWQRLADACREVLA